MSTLDKDSLVLQDGGVSTMQAAEFEGFTSNHSVPVPEVILDGTRVKIIILEKAAPLSVHERGKRFKALLCEVAQGLEKTICPTLARARFASPQTSYVGV